MTTPNPPFPPPLPMPHGEAPPPFPQTSPTPDAPISPPPYALYDASEVALATFLGVLFGGPLLLGLNYFRLKKPAAGWIAIVLGAIGALTLVFLAAAIASSTFASVVTVGAIAGMSALAKKLQGADVAEHLRRGGKLASRVPIVVIGLVASTAYLLLVLYPSLHHSRGARLALDKDEIYYSGSATQSDAQALADELKRIGYLTDQGVTVFLQKGSSGTIVSFVVKDGSWNDDKDVSDFNLIGQDIAPIVGGFPITVRMVNDTVTTEKELAIAAPTTAPSAPAANAVPAAPDAGATVAPAATPAPSPLQALQRAMAPVTQPANPLSPDAPTNPPASPVNPLSPAANPPSPPANPLSQ